MNPISWQLETEETEAVYLHPPKLHMVLCKRRERVKMTEEEQNGTNQGVKSCTANQKAELVLHLIRGIPPSPRRPGRRPSPFRRSSDGLKKASGTCKTTLCLSRTQAEQYKTQIKNLQAKVG